MQRKPSSSVSFRHCSWDCASPFLRGNLACMHAQNFPCEQTSPTGTGACMHKTSPQPNKKTRSSPGKQQQEPRDSSRHCSTGTHHRLGVLKYSSSPGKRQREPRDSSRHCSTQRQRHPIIPAWSRSKNKNVSAGGTSILERFRAFFFSVGKEPPPGGSGPSPAWACRCACCPARSAKMRSAEIRFPSRQRHWPA
jgi:hypothetical protein